ncbi:MAG: sigma-70 family RNA polymerase sigma factor [Phenylobacterium sp.]|uniref:RNA polymerase sigma factor n=1 Tax=Phenylobacterium sp. TaxID=1871053 RepID=UPI0025ECDD31|nr:sigma-70 family RNA polymerase sigma factor [Phenylobacterium sp.]MBI1197917.1 sigma-70 family RNA polymerase sigma factor [Phenylobacterium sp.]
MSRPQPSSSARVRPGCEDPLPAEAPAALPLRDPSWRAHLVWLRAAIGRRFGADLADDIAQETCLRVVQRSTAEPVENLRGLLMTVAANLARDAFRRRRVRAEHLAAAETLAGEGAERTAEDDLLVREAILSLPPDLRDTFLLSKIGGLTNREIAQRCGLSVRAIDKRLQKAMTLFVARLRD